MMLTCDQASTEKRFELLRAYMTQSVLDGQSFICPHAEDCKRSHGKTFYEGQLHHLGRYYDLSVDGAPLRVAIVGQEYGHDSLHVSLDARYAMIMNSGTEKRFRHEPGRETRNPHMRGTTSALRLLHGKEPGAAHQDEYIDLADGTRAHLFDTFALVNLLLCSAVDGSSSESQAKPIMKQNCLSHFREALRLLEPTVIIVQSKGFWPVIRQAFDDIQQISKEVFQASLGPATAWIAVFSHPSTKRPDMNWGNSDHTPYLQGPVRNAIALIRSRILPDAAHAMRS